MTRSWHDDRQSVGHVVVACSSIVFDSASGGSQLVAPEAIARALGAAGARVRLVVLNACYSAPLADALRAQRGTAELQSNEIDNVRVDQFRCLACRAGLGALSLQSTLITELA